jgi:hypothetical protein
MALVEVLISSGIVGILFVAAVSTATSARTTRLSVLDRVKGREFAQALLVEINNRAYNDPTGLATDNLGLDSGEVVTTRSGFDDVDDYAGYTQSPPADLTGAALAENTWRWSVTVTRVNDFSGTAATSETGFKKIEITVHHGKKVVSRVTNYRTAGGG